LHSVVCYYQTNPNFKPNLPTEIAFLQTAAVAHNARQRHAMDVFFDILVADAQVSFDVVKRSYRGMVIGKWRDETITWNQATIAFNHKFPKI